MGVVHPLSMKRLSVALVAVAGAALVLSGCGRDVPASAQVGTTTIAPSDRGPMPPIAGTTLTGATLDLASLRGKVVVLNSWASWCAPCKEEVPAFVSLAGSSDPSDVTVVGLNVNDEPAAATDFAKQHSMAYPSIVDPDGHLLSTIPDVPPESLPSTVILDRQGRIAARIIGAAKPDDLTGIVAAVVAETPGS